MSPLGVSTLTLGVSTVLLVIPAAVVNLEWPRLGALSAMLALGVACTGLAFWAYYALIATAGAARAAVSTYLAPGVAVICGIGLLGEEFTATSALGLALILLGSWLSTRSITDTALGMLRDREPRVAARQYRRRRRSTTVDSGSTGMRDGSRRSSHANSVPAEQSDSAEPGPPASG